MTANEMRKEFDYGYNSIANFDSPGYKDREVSHFLTKAQERFVKTHYHPKGNRYREGFDNTEKRRKDLNELIKGPRDSSGSLITYKASNQNRSLKGGTLFGLPDDLWLTIYEEAAVETDSCEDDTIISPITEKEVKVNYRNVRPIVYDEYSYFKSNPFRKPREENKTAWRMDISSSEEGDRLHEILTGDGYAVHEYYIRYIKTPNQIKVDTSNPSNQTDCELHPSTHREIVDEAVSIALERTSNPRFKSTEALNQDSE